MTNSHHAALPPRLQRANELARQLAARGPVTAGRLAYAAGVSIYCARAWLRDLEALGVSYGRQQGHAVATVRDHLLAALEALAPQGGPVRYRDLMAATGWQYGSVTVHVSNFRRDHPDLWRWEIAAAPPGRQRKVSPEAPAEPIYKPTTEQIQAHCQKLNPPATERAAKHWDPAPQLAEIVGGYVQEWRKRTRRKPACSCSPDTKNSAS